MKYVIIGASAAGIHAASKLRELDAASAIVVISKDETVYSRCILYHHLKGIRNLKQLSFVDEEFMEKNKIDWISGHNACKIDTKKKEITLENDTHVTYDKVLIASGTHTFFPPIPGLREADNVVGFRDFCDVEEIERRLPNIENIIVMGAGLVGVDVIAGLLPHKKCVSLVEMGPYMLPLQLDEIASKTYQDAFEKEGIKQYYGVGISKLHSTNNQVYEVELENGKRIPCDLLICAAGVRANIDFLQGSGIDTDKLGLLYDAHGKTNIDDVYGAGDVSGRSPIWPAAVKEGIIAAYNMVGHEKSMDDFFASKCTMNFLEIPTMSLGRTAGYDEMFTVESMQDEDGNYKKIIHRNGVIYGALLQGDLSYAGILTQLIKEKIDVSKVKKPLFQIDYSDFFQELDNFEFTFENERG